MKAGLDRSTPDSGTRHRRRFSAERFRQQWLKEYAEVFPIVSGDFSFYSFPTALFWQKLFGQVDAPFRFAFKLPEDIAVSVFPNHPRYRLRAGQVNTVFLDPEVFEREFLTLLRPYEDRVALLILEFPASVANAFPETADFCEALSRFFSALFWWLPLRRGDSQQTASQPELLSRFARAGRRTPVQLLDPYAFLAGTNEHAGRIHRELPRVSSIVTTGPSL